MRYANRTEAGRKLALRLEAYTGAEDLIVLGLPRGGVPVAATVAEQLGVPLDTYVVRKVGVPGHEELAMGAVAGAGVTVRNEFVLEHLGVPAEVFEEHAEAQRREVRRREERYRRGLPSRELRDRTVVLIDDGLATGATMKAAVEAVRKSHPARLIVAVPVAARATAESLRQLLTGPGEEFICLNEPEMLDGVGRWYDDFRQIDDDEVCQLLESAARQRAARAAPS